MYIINFELVPVPVSYCKYRREIEARSVARWRWRNEYDSGSVGDANVCSKTERLVPGVCDVDVAARRCELLERGFGY